MSNRKIIIDTDPGLDDAIAILFAVHSGRFDVLGLTSVAGNLGIDVTTRNAGRLLALLGRRDIAVVSGASAPLARKGINEVAIHGEDGLGGVTLPDAISPLPGYAPFWIADQLRNAPPGTIDILALGPLTNIALLLRDHADAAARIGRLIVMGGAINDKGNVGPHSEFNFASDPEAVAMVLNTELNTTIVPLDVTRKVRADRAYLDALREKSIAGDAAADLIAAYFNDGRESRPLHDPCVMLYALEPELFDAKQMSFTVDTSTGPDAGALLPGNGHSEVTVLMNVDAPGALRLLAEGLA